MKKTKHKDLKITGLIASKNPVEALVQTVNSLFKGGASMVIVVDDGSDDADSLAVFDEVEALGARVIHLPENIGKAMALKKGFEEVPVDSVIAQADDDTLAGNLMIPMRMLAKGKADIVDIRVETNRTKSMIGLIQELDYWMINAFIKRLHNIFRARLWMSGASVMYSYAAGQIMILSPALTITEDTEGMFRAREKGFRVRFCAKKEAQFITMVPEDFSSLRRQWKRWSQGNGQVIGIYGLGGKLKRVTLMNIFAWVALVIFPVLAVIISGIIPTIEWLLGFSLVIAILGAISLRRFAVILVFWLLPVISVVWIYHALEGLIKAAKEPMTKKHLTWVSPKRTTFR